MADATQTPDIDPAAIDARLAAIRANARTRIETLRAGLKTDLGIDPEELDELIVTSGYKAWAVSERKRLGRSLPGDAPKKVARKSRTRI